MSTSPMTEKETKALQFRMHVLELAIRASVQGTDRIEIVETAKAFHAFAKGTLDKPEVA